MSEAEESPAQRQARIRRERREAKIKAGGTDRLDRITRVSGRTPESMKHESPSPSPIIRPAASPSPSPQPPLTNAADPSQIQAQEEYLRSILRAQPPSNNGSEQGQADDPMVKMLQSLMGGTEPLDPNGGEMPTISADEISKATGIPSWITNTFLGKPPETEEQKKQALMWKTVHILFSVLVGIYTLWTVAASVSAFGVNPPKPAVMRNPFLIFVVGELLVETGRLTLGGMGSPKDIGAWYQLAKDIGRDSSIVIFLLGMGMWWNT